MSAHDPDFLRRIQLERADAAKKALEEGIQRIRNHPAQSESYRQAFKIAERLLIEEKAKL